MDDETYAPFVLVDEARAWIMDVVGDLNAADEWDRAHEDDVMDYVRKRYEGGLLAFTADVYAYYGYGTLAATLREGIAAR